MSMRNKSLEAVPPVEFEQPSSFRDRLQVPSSPSSESSLTTWVVNLNDAVFRSDDELVGEQVYVASSTRAAGTSGTSDSDTSRLSMAAHVSGTCWPCVFYPTTRGCGRGDRCAYCHFNHPITMLERRVRKRTRDKIKRKLSEILNPPVDLEEVHEELQTEAARHMFARALIQGYLEDPNNFLSTS